MITRRSFIGSTAALIAAGGARTTGAGSAATGRMPGSGRLPIGFSTLGSPKWDWLTTLDFAASHGFAAIELRGLLDQMDLTKRAEFQPGRLAQTKRELRDRSLVITDLGASASMHEVDPVKRDASAGSEAMAKPSGSGPC